MEENSLTHYGVIGMKWGHRKSKTSKGSNVKNSKKSKSTSKKTFSVKKKIQNITHKVDKEKVKNIAKATAKVAGTVAITSLLGYVGGMAFSEFNRLIDTNADLSGRNYDLENELKATRSRETDYKIAYNELKRKIGR